ncbi:DUF1642 domain-containing protein [Listeria newyorkensis]|uniref:DUF1642 domain-containing protein n=1 Tax=Listeria newyorkensis TaxID=1497681 RepID=A0A841Z161_9LIST|nr:DUF1642 domain-containing protein [Listeria newyorkensis]MBC1459355.1 DUF1642 domain-containing protein [Listeria newyorkensis]
MTQKFQVGDRVQVIRDNKVEIDTIMTKRYNTYQLDKEPRDCWIDGWQLAPAPALVVVPENVKDEIVPALHCNKTKEDALKHLLSIYHDENYFEREVYLWITNNFAQFISAVLNGYKVEKEPLYEIVIMDDGGDRQLLMDFGEGGIEINYESANEGRWKQRFTKAEISAIETRYNKKYSDFAVPVEEGEG